MNIDRALTDRGFFVDHDPHPLWQQLRREDPVHWTEGLGRPFWSLTMLDATNKPRVEVNRFGLLKAATMSS